MSSFARLSVKREIDGQTDVESLDEDDNDVFAMILRIVITYKKNGTQLYF